MKIDRVVYLPIAAEADEYLRYRAGDIDITMSVPVQHIEALRTERPSELRIGPTLGTYFLGFNLHRAPFADNPELRLALSLALDREGIATRVLHGMQRPAYGLVPPGTAGYEPQSHAWASTGVAERQALARRLYASATKDNAAPLKLRVTYGSSQVVRTALIAVAAMWKETLGIEVDIVTEEFRSFLETQKDPSNWEVLRTAWYADYNDASTFLELFRRDAPSNVFGYGNTAFDELLDQAGRSGNALERAALLEKAERMLLEEQAFIPMFHMLSRRLVSPRVVGFEMTPLNRTYSRHLQLRGAN